GRAVAVADLGWIRFWGLPAWLTWLLVHIVYLIQFQNRLLVLMQWAWNYFTRNRSARLITGEPGPDDPRRGAKEDHGCIQVSTRSAGGTVALPGPPAPAAWRTPGVRSAAGKRPGRLRSHEPARRGCAGRRAGRARRPAAAWARGWPRDAPPG